MSRITTFTLVVLAFTAFAFGDEWYIETVDSGWQTRQVGRWTSIALDASNNPHISYCVYYDNYPYEDDRDVKYAYYDGSSWQIEFVDTEGSVGFDTSIALDTFDNPHISYIDGSPNNDLKYARYDGSYWQIESVDTGGNVGHDTSIALDTSGNPHISYLDYTNKDLKYAYYDGSSWQIESVDTEGRVGSDTSIALDTSDNPHISYSDGSNLDLKYAYYYGSIWYIESVDTDNNVGNDTSIALDTSDNPHISYLYGYFGDLKYAYYDGSSWQIEFVDTEGWVGFDTSITLDTFDNPHISYHDSSNGDLKYAYYNGSSWQIESVDTEGHVGSDSSIALDTSDNPHISYYHGSLYDLKYARYNNTPPADFELISPADGAEVPDPPTLDWENADDAQPVTYDVWYATDPSFDPHEEVTELTDSTYTFPEGTLTDDTTYYWKVRAWDGRAETWSGPDDYWSFTVEDEVTDIAVTSFSAESARDGVELTWECANPGVGFNLYRSEEAVGARTKLRETLNAELITGESPYIYLDAGVSDGVTYAYWLEAMDVGGSSETFGPVVCTAGTFVPSSYALYQSRPNPARGAAVIAFDLPEGADVTLTIYDLSGRKVTTLVNETLPAGAHERPVAGLAPGVYVYRLDAGEFSGVMKMVVID